MKPAFKILSPIEGTESILVFFIYLVDGLGLKTGFHPDTPFEDYVATDSFTTFLFDAEQAAQLNKTMNACRTYCELNKVDIYEVAIKATKFESFQQSHKIITDKAAIVSFFNDQDLKGEEYRSMVAVHVYSGCYWIEEWETGKYQLIFENVGQVATFEELELSLYDLIEL